MGSGKQPRRFYNPSHLEDAPEHYELARALGTLTVDTWDHETRSLAERIMDFRCAYPDNNPTRYTRQDRSLAHEEDNNDRTSLESRFISRDWTPGSLHELLARYGLRLRGGPKPVPSVHQQEPILDVTRRRNRKLRVLHGGVDVEARDMDAAKADYLDREEKKLAAQQIRKARKRMAEELRLDGEADLD